MLITTTCSLSSQIHFERSADVLSSQAHTNESRSNVNRNKTTPPTRRQSPSYSIRSVQVHHTRHHQTYVSNLNGVLTGEHGGLLSGHSLTDIQKNVSALPDAIRTTVVNHGGGHYNHCLFFSILKPETERMAHPTDELKAAVNTAFGSEEDMIKQFNSSAMKVFGSGWTWLAVDASGALRIVNTRNQENPLMGPSVTNSEPLTPILGLDVWEHAMYLKYLNRRPEYIEAFWNIVNWEQVSANYDSVKQGGAAIIETPMDADE